MGGGKEGKKKKKEKAAYFVQKQTTTKAVTMQCFEETAIRIGLVNYHYIWRNLLLESVANICSVYLRGINSKILFDQRVAAGRSLFTRRSMFSSGANLASIIKFLPYQDKTNTY